MPFTAHVKVRFGDVDWARIAYYPRLLHLLHVAFEDLFEHHVGIPYATVLAELNLGFPAAHIECDFKAPVRFGETLAVAITVPRMGQSSVDFDHRVCVKGPDDLRATAHIVRVAVDMTTLRPVPVPDRLREAFARIRE